MAKEQNYQVIISELVRRSNEDARRLRVLEQRIDAVETRLSSMEDSLLEKAKKNHMHFTELDESVRRVNEEMITLKNTLDKINKQINNFARKRDIKEIEHMLDLLTPQTEDVIAMEE
jgi:chromosome segregation ATPase